MTAKPKTKPEDQEIQEPAVITPLHRQNRIVSPVAGAKKGYSKLSMIDLAYEQGRLGELDNHVTRLRRDAGREFSDMWDAQESAGRDSTQALNGSRSTGAGLPITIRQLEASQRLKKIRERMGVRDWIILRAFCAEGMLPSEAVRLAGCDKETRVSGRVRDAMDELIIALGWQVKAVR